MDTFLLSRVLGALLFTLVMLVSFEQLKYRAGHAPLISSCVVLVFKETDFWSSVPPGANVTGHTSLFCLVLGLLDLLMDLLFDDLFSVLR